MCVSSLNRSSRLLALLAWNAAAVRQESSSAQTTLRLDRAGSSSLSLRSGRSAAEVAALDSSVLPDPEVNFAQCGRQDRSRICDPAKLLTPEQAEAAEAKLRKLATPQRPPLSPNAPTLACPEKGGSVQAYLGVISAIPSDAFSLWRAWNLEDSAKALARSVGTNWGVLGGACQDGLLMLYSAQDGYLALVGDEALVGPFPAKLNDATVRHLQRQATSVLHETTGAVVLSALDELSAALQNVQNPSLSNGASSSFGAIALGTPLDSLGVDRATILLYVCSCCMGLVLALLLVCCIYDTAAQWQHRNHFNACRTKLQCVHEVLLKPTGEVHLCPICVDFLPNKGRVSSPHQVVFLCGHKFHTECANRWFLLHPSGPGRCPVCDLAHSYSGTMEEKTFGHVEPVVTPETNKASRAVNTANEVKSFLLRSLASQYPSIVTPAHLKRWMSCNTEIWLAELTKPKFQSIWSKAPEAEDQQGSAKGPAPTP